jgi:acetylglutamate kinase
MGNTIAGGMIPKIESCVAAIESGTKEVKIVNGTQPGILNQLISEKEPIGTTISK